jgi:hypothetical protein
MRHTLTRLAGLTGLLGSLLLAACSGVEIIPDDTSAFAATGYTRYAWRSEPLSQDGYSKSKVYQADPAIRAAVDKRLAELGYRQVSADDAQFLVDYVAAAGFNQGQLARNASNVTPVPTAMINRQVNQAEVDNAYALGGVKEMGNIALVFLNSSNKDVLWKVTVSSVIEDANRVDKSAVSKAMRQSLSTLPEASVR